MSCKVLPAHRKNKQPSLFYLPHQIRFKHIASHSLKRLPRDQYVLPSNPWQSLKRDEVTQLVERLGDQPEQLYDMINRRRTKFTLLKASTEKEPLRLLRDI